MRDIHDYDEVLVLSGAYGRTYASKEAAEKDWKEGKDFRIGTGPYCSIRDTQLLMDMYNKVFIRSLLGFVRVL